MELRLDCLFCRIMAGLCPAHVVWSNEEHVAFLTPFPNTEGVTLVASRRHLPSELLALTESQYTSLFLAARHVAALLTQRLGVARVGVIAEGVGVDHAHLKLFPMHGMPTQPSRQRSRRRRAVFRRYPGYLASHDGPRMKDEELLAIATRIRGTTGDAESSQAERREPGHHLTLEAYGVRVAVTTNDPQWLERLLDSLPSVWCATPASHADRRYTLLRDTGAAPEGHRLYADERALLRTADTDTLIEVLVSDMEMFLAARADGLVCVHAGVVGWHGRAIVFPGSSGCGKTTLVSASGPHGAVYYSDEFALFDRHGRVHPYPRPLWFKPGNGDTHRARACDLDMAVGDRPLPVSLVVMTEHRPAAVWRPRPLSRGRAVLSLLSNTMAAGTRTESVLGTLATVVSGAIVIGSPRGEAHDVIPDVLKRAERGMRTQS